MTIVDEETSARCSPSCDVMMSSWIRANHAVYWLAGNFRRASGKLRPFALRHVVKPAGTAEAAYTRQLRDRTRSLDRALQLNAHTGLTKRSSDTAAISSNSMGFTGRARPGHPHRADGPRRGSGPIDFSNRVCSPGGRGHWLTVELPKDASEPLYVRLAGATAGLIT